MGLPVRIDKVKVELHPDELAVLEIVEGGAFAPEHIAFAPRTEIVRVLEAAPFDIQFRSNLASLYKHVPEMEDFVDACMGRIQDSKIIVFPICCDSFKFL